MLTEDQIKFLNKVCPDRWIEENNVINVVGNVNISDMNLTEIPVQFGHIGGDFYCHYNKLTTLKGAPSIVEGYFNCDYNQLTSLEGGPKITRHFYSCESNYLTSLIGAPKIHKYNFYCERNKLTSLEGCPSTIEYNLYCRINPDLEYLWGIGRVEDNVWYGNENEINDWIIKCMRRNIIFPHFTLEENINWIMREQKYSILLGAPTEILQYFSSYIKNILLDLC